MFTISDDDSQEDILRKLEEVLELEEKLEEQLQEQELDEESEETIDWLQTRRATLVDILSFLCGIYTSSCCCRFSSMMR